MEILKKLSKDKLYMIVGGAIAVIIAVLMAYLLNRSNLVPLYRNLSLEDQRQISLKLQMFGLDINQDATGNILVEKNRAAQLRMMLANEGLPSDNSGVGYEIFDKSDFLGTSQFVNNVNLTRALEGELARTISSLSIIDGARVHVVLPRNDLFSKIGSVPSASVVVHVKRGKTLSPAEVKGIVHLVVSAVPDLKPENVALIDSSGNSLKLEAAENSEEEGNLSNIDYKNKIEKNLEKTIEEMLVKLVGPGKVKASVSAQIDFDKQVVSSELFDPDKQVVRSSRVSNEQERGSGAGKNISVATNIPNAVQDVQGTGTELEPTRSKSDEVTNYEISKTVTNTVLSWGKIRQLSVGVLLDGSYELDATSGKSVYKPRSNDEIENIRALVTAAVGLDTGRGDRIEVVNLQFQGLPGQDAADNGNLIMGLGVEFWQNLLAKLVNLIFLLLIIAVISFAILLLFKKPQDSISLRDFTSWQAFKARYIDAKVSAYGSPEAEPVLAAALAGSADAIAAESLDNPEGKLAYPEVSGEGSSGGEEVEANSDKDKLHKEDLTYEKLLEDIKLDQSYVELLNYLNAMVTKNLESSVLLIKTWLSRNKNAFPGKRAVSIILMKLNESVAKSVINFFEKDEIKHISRSMASLGEVTSSEVERVIVEFIKNLNSLEIVGNSKVATLFLKKFLHDDNLTVALDSINELENKNIWERINSLDERALSEFLRSEHPQTAAVVLAYLDSKKAAKALAALGKEQSFAIIKRVLALDAVKPNALSELERLLEQELKIDSDIVRKRPDNIKVVAEIFNYMDRQSEKGLMGMLDKYDDKMAGQIRKMMFTYDDLINVDADSVHKILRLADKVKLAKALKSGAPEVRDFFLAQVPQRAMRILTEEINGLGQLKPQESEEAQLYMVELAKKVMGG